MTWEEGGIALLKRLYDKSKIGFAIVWIITYCVLMSVGDVISAFVGIDKSVTFVLSLVLSGALLLFLWKNQLLKSYGLCRPVATPGSMLYYLPILAMLSANLWYGVERNESVVEVALHILTMLCVGFLEEVIFRGLLFGAMRENNEKVAILVSSLTFGVGHMINLFNGSGIGLLANLLQVVYATAAGFLFVMIYIRSHSLWIPIASHGIFNAMSIFIKEENVTAVTQILTSLLLTLILLAYALYLLLFFKEKHKGE